MLKRELEKYEGLEEIIAKGWHHLVRRVGRILCPVEQNATF
jgi:hypothetical protein